MVSGTFFEDLPDEVILKVFGFCCRESLQVLATVNSKFSNMILTSFNLNGKALGVHALPPELLLHIFTFLDRPSLGRAAQACQLFKQVAYADSLWAGKARNALATNNKLDNSVHVPTARDQVRVSRNWTQARYSEQLLFSQNVRYMPRIQLEQQRLWVSWGNRIWSHSRLADGTVKRTTTRVLTGHTNDVSRFVVKNGIVVSGGMDQALFGWDANTGGFLFAKRYCHQSEVSAVDVLASKQVVLTGSRDGYVKIWSYDGAGASFPELCNCVNIGDRIWSLAASPNEACVAVGSAGFGGVPALNILDLHTNTLLVPNNGSLQKGAGILDLHWLTNQTFLSCGYDTRARLWDLRTGGWVKKWTEPFDEALYCLTSDDNMTLVCGTARHGLVRLWDMRQAQPVQMFYAKHPHRGQSSPVYSLALDPFHLYVAMDQCLSLLSFDGYNNSQGMGAKIRI